MPDPVYSEDDFDEGDATYGDESFDEDDFDNDVPSSVQESPIELPRSPHGAEDDSAQSSDSLSEGLEALRARARGGAATERGVLAHAPADTPPAARRPSPMQEKEPMVRKDSTPRTLPPGAKSAAAAAGGRGGEGKKYLDFGRAEQVASAARPWYARDGEEDASSQRLPGYGMRPVPSPEMPPPPPAPVRKTLSETPPMTPALLVKPECFTKLAARDRLILRLQRVMRGHIARRAWVKPIREVLSWRKHVSHLHVSKRRPMLVHILPTRKQDEMWMGENARCAHILVPIGCPDTAKFFPNIKAIKTWWYAVPDKVRRLFDTSQATVLPRWDDEPKEDAALAVPAPGYSLGDAPTIGPGAYTVNEKSEVLHPRVTGGNFPRAARFGQGATSVIKERSGDGKGGDGKGMSVPNKPFSKIVPHPPHAPSAPQGAGRDESGGRKHSKVPRLKLPEGAANDSDLSSSSARVSKSVSHAQLETERYRQKMATLVQQQLAAQQRLAAKEKEEVEAARERIAALKRDNSRHLNKMRNDLANCRHPLYGYGDRFSMAAAGGDARGKIGWRGDKAPAWATYKPPEQGGGDAQVELEYMAPISERGRAGPDKKDFFSLLATITETSRTKVKDPAITSAALALASKYEGIGVKFAGLDESSDVDPLSLLPEQGWSSTSPTSPAGKSPPSKSPHSKTLIEVPGRKGGAKGEESSEQQPLGPKTPAVKARARPARHLGSSDASPAVLKVDERKPEERKTGKDFDGHTAAADAVTSKPPVADAARSLPSLSAAPSAPPVSVTEEPVDVTKMTRVERMKYLAAQKEKQEAISAPLVAHTPVVAATRPVPAASAAPSKPSVPVTMGPVDITKMTRVERMKYLAAQKEEQEPNSAPLAAQPPPPRIKSSLEPQGQSSDESSDDDDFLTSSQMRAAIKQKGGASRVR
jgi:hypothetical protein